MSVAVECAGFARPCRRAAWPRAFGALALSMLGRSSSAEPRRYSPSSPGGFGWGGTLPGPCEAAHVAAACWALRNCAEPAGNFVLRGGYEADIYLPRAMGKLAFNDKTVSRPEEALQKWHATFEDMQQAVAEVLDHLERYEEQLASLMTERFHLSPRIETVVVGLGKAA